MSLTATAAEPRREPRTPFLPLPAGARALYAAVAAAALVAAAAALAQLPADAASWLRFAVLAAAGATAQVFTVRTGRNTGFDTSIAFIVAAALLLPPELVALMALVQRLPEWLHERYPWYIQTFNIANLTLDALAAWAAAELVAESGAGPDELRWALGGIAAAAVFVSLNHFLLAAMLRLARGHTFRESELFAVRTLATALVLAGIGVALAALWEANPWLVPAVIAPLVWSHRFFSTLALLRESEGRFRAMFELAPVGAGLVDLDRRVVATNRALERMLGYTGDELAALPAETYADAEDEVLDRRLFAELVAGTREHYELETRYRAREGRTVWARLAVSLVRDADGRPKFGIRMVEDTTERKRAEESLRASEERYRELFENANDMVFTLDLEGRFTAVNRAGERITGYDRTHLLGRPFAELLVDTGEPPAGGETESYECELVSSGGRRVSLEVASRLIRVAGRPVGVQAIARDVSERRALEEQLRQAQKMEAVGQLAGGVAHDFNNLLTAIGGYTELALGRIDPADAKLRGDVEEIKRSSERAGALTRQLLAFGRKQILQPKPLRLDELAGGLDAMLRRLIDEHIEIAREDTPGLGLVRADPGQLEQVLVNLVVNARDAMPDGGRVTIETANADLDEAAARAFDGASPGGYVTLTVRDTGEGIDAETLPRIFEPFFTTKEQGKGTGLGLATVYGIVQQSGGFLGVESEAGAGAAFRVYLPRLEGETLLDEPEAAEPDDALPAGTETVLLVEDEVVVRDLLREVLETSGYVVLEAEDGLAALAVAEAHEGSIDLLLTDVVMPKLSGRELVERFHASRPGTRVLYTSGYTDGAIASDGQLEPGTGFLQKPFSFSELTRKVRAVLDTPFRA